MDTRYSRAHTHCHPPCACNSVHARIYLDYRCVSFFCLLTVRGDDRHRLLTLVSGSLLPYLLFNRRFIRFVRPLDPNQHKVEEFHSMNRGSRSSRSIGRLTGRDDPATSSNAIPSVLAPIRHLHRVARCHAHTDSPRRSSSMTVFVINFLYRPPGPIIRRCEIRGTRAREVRADARRIFLHPASQAGSAIRRCGGV